MKDITFEGLPKAMEIALQELSKIQKELTSIKQSLEAPKQEEFMSTKEVCEYLNISMTTL